MKTAKCPFCSKVDWGEMSANVDGRHAHISFAGGYARYSVDKQFNFCPVCGAPNPNKNRGDGEIPFAETLEKGIKALIDGGAENVALLGRLRDGTTLTAFENASVEDKAVLAWHVLSTAIMQLVVGNIDMVRDALDRDEMEGDD